MLGKVKLSQVMTTVSKKRCDEFTVELQKKEVAKTMTGVMSRQFSPAKTLCELLLNLLNDVPAEQQIEIPNLAFRQYVNSLSIGTP